MQRRMNSLLTKLLIIIVFIVAMPDRAFNQDKGAKSVKTKSKGSNKRVRNSYGSRKRSSKRNWKNQDKATRKRMKRAAKNARRRQRGKPMKNQRLTELDPTISFKTI